MLKRNFLPLAGALLALALPLAACAPADSGNVEYTVAVNTETLVVFTAPDGIETDSLKAYLDGLVEAGEISYTIEDGMITSLNGTENMSGLTSGSYWMLYSDLTELDGVTYTDPTFGTYTYAGKQLASCSYGAEGMPVVEGYTYAIVYEETSW